MVKLYIEGTIELDPDEETWLSEQSQFTDSSHSELYRQLAKNLLGPTGFDVDHAEIA